MRAALIVRPLADDTIVKRAKAYKGGTGVRVYVHRGDGRSTQEQ